MLGQPGRGIDESRQFNAGLHIDIGIDATFHGRSRHDRRESLFPIFNQYLVNWGTSDSTNPATQANHIKPLNNTVQLTDISDTSLQE
jgi:hypothetical protein